MADSKIRVVIDADASDLSRELSKAGAQVNTFGRQVGGQSRSVAAFNAVASQQAQNLRAVGTAAKYAAGGAALLAAGGAAWAVKEGIQFNATMESNRLALKQFLGGAKEADAFLGKMFETAKKTPFEFADITKAARRLLAFQFTAKETEKTLRAVGNATAALGGSAEMIDRVTMALGQIKAKGRVQGDELLQLAEAGIPAYQILQEKLHLTMDEVRNIGRAGVDADAAIRALTEGLNERFGSAAAAQAKTFQGQMSTLHDNVDQTLGAMTEGLFDQLKVWLPEVNKTANQIAAVWKRDDLSPEQKFQDSLASIEKNLGPAFRQIESEVKNLELDKKLGEAIGDLTPVVAQAAAEAGARGAIALVNGFLASNVWGRLAIGAWLFSKMGGFAAIRASGAAAGGAAASGTVAGFAGANIGTAFKTQLATALSAGAIGGGGFKGYGKAAGTQVLAGASAAINSSAAKGIGIGLAAMMGLDTVSNLTDKNADNVIDRLKQIDAEGRGTLGTLSRALGGGEGGPLGFLNQGGVAHRGDSAHQLVQIAEEINTAGAERAQQLREEANSLLRNLDLTRKQRDAYNGILNSKGQQAGDAQTGIDNLASGYVTRFQDITKRARENSRLAARAYGQGSSEWRSASARNMNAAVFAIRQGMKDGVIETGKGKRRIKQLLERRDLLMGADPIGLAQGFRKSWLRAGSINGASIKRIIGQLDQMPKGARQKAANTMIAMANSMEQNNKLPKGAMSKLRSALLTELDITGKQGNDKIKKSTGGWGNYFSQFGKSTKKTIDDAAKNVKSGFKDIDAAGAKSTRNAKRTTSGLISSFKGLPSPVRDSLSTVTSDLNTALAAVGSDKTIDAVFSTGGPVQQFARGGLARVAGSGRQDTVPLRGNDIKAMVAPGEDLAVINRHQRPLLDHAVAQTYGNRGLGDFFSKNSKPHYLASGGMMDSAGKIRKPSLTGSPQSALDVGQPGLDDFYQAAKKYYRENAIDPGVGEFDGHKVAGWIIPILKWARTAGWSGAVNSGYRSFAEQAELYANRASNPNPVAPPGSSNHEGSEYPRGAVDVSDYSGLNPLTNDSSGPFPGKLKWFGMGDPVHFSGTGHNQGGFVRMANGGVVRIVGEDLIEKHGFNLDGASGILGNAYREAYPPWNPASVGTGGGGLWGFTTSPVSLADLQNRAAEVGVDWTDPKFQTHFMLGRGNPTGMSLRGSLNAAGSPERAAEIFMDEWERPGVPALEDRQHGARLAYNMLKSGNYEQGGGSGPSAAESKVLREKAKLEQFKKAARNAKTLPGKRAALWDLVEYWGSVGDFSDSEKSHTLDRVKSAAAQVNPFSAIPILRNLSSYLDKHVDVGGDGGIDKGISRVKAAGSKVGKRKRKKKLSEISLRGLAGGARTKLRGNSKEVERLVELIEDGETLAGADWGPGGSEYTDSETNGLIGFNKALLQTLQQRKGLIGYSLKEIGQQLGKDSNLSKEIEKARPKGSMTHWKLPGLLGRRKRAIALRSQLRTDLEDVVGISGNSGQIFDTKMAIKDLGFKDSDTSGGDSETADLLREQLTNTQKNYALSQAQYGVMSQFLQGIGGNFIGAFAHGTGGKRVGRTGMALLHENEMVTPDPKGPYGNALSTTGNGFSGQPQVTLVLEGNAGQLVRLVDSRIDGKQVQIQQKTNAILGRQRRQTSVAPGR